MRQKITSVLLLLFMAFSAKAQTMKIYKDNVLVKEYTSAEANKVVYGVGMPIVRMANRFNGNLHSGYVMSDGSENTSDSGTVYTDRIPCMCGDNICLSYNDDGTRKQGEFRYTCFFDVDGKVIGGGAAVSVAKAPANAAYVVLSFSKDIQSGICISNTKLGDLELHPSKEHCVVDAYPSTGLLNAVEEAYKNGCAKVVVHAGNYDLIEEYTAKYGSDYFDNYEGYFTTDNLNDRGLWLENIELDFKLGAKVFCKYNGSNSSVMTYFSAFATGNNVVIDGLDLETNNLRYGIHSDYNMWSDETYMTISNGRFNCYRDCDNTNKAIGAGLGEHVHWIFSNNIFEAKYKGYVARIHNNKSKDAQSQIEFTGNYVADKGWIIVNDYGPSTHVSTCTATGNSWKIELVHTKETKDSEDNFDVTLYDNELRE